MFSSGSFRIHEDLYLLSDQVFGWDSNYSVLRKAGIEAVRTHPGTYASGVLETVWQQLSKSYFRSAGGTSSQAQPAAPVKATEVARCPRRPRESRSLPGKTSGSRVRTTAFATSGPPERATTSRSVIRSERPRFDAILRERDSLFAALPDRQGNAQLSLRLNQLSRWFPRPDLWILLGLVGLVLRRPRGMRILVALGLSALFVIVFNALGLFADPRFALPVAPAFVLFGCGAMLGRR